MAQSTYSDAAAPSHGANVAYQQRKALQLHPCVVAAELALPLLSMFIYSPRYHHGRRLVDAESHHLKDII